MGRWLVNPQVSFHVVVFAQVNLHPEQTGQKSGVHLFDGIWFE